MLLPWIFVSLLFLIAELGHPGAYFFLSFSIGSFVSFLTSVWCVDVTEQIIIFFIASFLGFYLLQKFVRVTQPKETKTGVDALVGKKIDSIKHVTHNVYEVKVQGQIWSAKFVHEPSLDTQHIVIKHIKGTHLILDKGA